MEEVALERLDISMYARALVVLRERFDVVSWDAVDEILIAFLGNVMFSEFYPSVCDAD